jgi:hypothetical protein
LLGSSLIDECELVAWVVEHNREDLEVGCSINVCKLRNYFILSQKVYDIVNSDVPLVVSQMAERELLAKQVEPRGPHKFQSKVHRRTLQRYALYVCC